MKLSNLLGIVTGLTVAVGSISPFCCSYSDIPVHADFGEFAGEADYICSLEGEEATALSTPGGAFVSGAMLALYLCTRDPISTGSSVNAENIAFFSGMYQNEGVIKRGVIVSMSGDWSGQDGYDFAFSDDFDLYLTATGIPTNLRCETHDGSGFKYYRFVFTPTSSGSNTLSVLLSNRKASSGCLTGIYGCQWGRSFMGLGVDISAGSIPELHGVTLQDKFTSGDFNVNGTRPIILGSGSYSRFPSGQLDLANPGNYFDNVLRPYVIENYPDYEYLLPDGDPELPTSPTIDFTIPTADLSPLNPSEVVSDYSTPVSFWWTLTNDILDTTGLKWLALFGLSCAIFTYIIWRLGR